MYLKLLPALCKVHNRVLEILNNDEKKPFNIIASYYKQIGDSKIEIPIDDDSLESPDLPIKSLKKVKKVFKGRIQRFKSYSNIESQYSLEHKKRIL